MRGILRPATALWVAVLVLHLGLDLVTGSVPDGERVLSAALGIALLAALLVALARVLPGEQRARAALLFLLLVAVVPINLGLELAIFTADGPVRLPGFVLSSLVWSAVYAALAVWLTPGYDPAPVAPRLGAQFATRSAGAWSLRFGAALLVYPLVYLIVGAFFFQFTKPYYTDPAWGLGLTLPPVGLVLEVQVLRGLVFIGALTGLLLAARRHALLGGLALAVVGGLTPLSMNTDWPLMLRVYHGLEILLQNLPAGALIIVLLGPPRDAGPSARAVPA
jgi:hypothetical protein